jgi:putative ATP-dependent endonuclease of OLD family
MDIVMQDGAAASFPISQHGFGTRSWVSFLTLSAFVDTQNEKIRADDEEAEQFIMLTMEEPEAHLHPQAQRQLFSQISKFSGQKVISTHSPSIVAQSTLADAIYFSKRDGKTSAVRYKSNVGTMNQDEKILREVINTRADVLFASAIVLCEGITEELALPVYFQEFFSAAPFSLGVDIIGIGGQNYKTYLSLIRDFELPWFIFSDGEQNAKNAVTSAVGEIFHADPLTMSNVVILDNGDDYEKQLIREGYGSLLIEAICEHENNTDFFENYIEQMGKQMGKGNIPRNYNGEEGRQRALADLCHSHKAEYALPVAKKIVAQEDKTKRVPKKVLALFSSLAAAIGANPIVTDEVIE